MDPISKFIVSYKIPVGAWGKAFFTFLTDNFNSVLRAFSNGLNFLLDGLVDILLLVPPVAAGAGDRGSRLSPAALQAARHRRRARPPLHHQPEPLEADGRDTGARGRSGLGVHG